MGQQQLLLLILSAVVVGVGIVMGITMFAENAAQANQDAVLQDLMTIASRAQAWYRRPAAMGGGGHSWSGISVQVINFSAANENSTDYHFQCASGNHIDIQGTCLEDPDEDGTNQTIRITIYPDSVSGTLITD